MDDDQRLEDLESALRNVPPMRDVPPHLAQICMGAAFAEPAHPLAARRPQIRRRRVYALIAAAAVVIGVGAVNLRGSDDQARRSAVRSVFLRGSGRAAAVVQIGAPAGATEPVVVSTSDLRTATAGRHYETWFRRCSTPIARARRGWSSRPQRRRAG